MFTPVPFPCGARTGAGRCPTKGSEMILLQPLRGAKQGSERRGAERWGNEEC